MTTGLRHGALVVVVWLAAVVVVALVAMVVVVADLAVVAVDFDVVAVDLDVVAVDLDVFVGALELELLPHAPTTKTKEKLTAARTIFLMVAT